MKLKYFVIGVGLLSVAVSVSGCKDERDEVCAFSWEEHGYGPADRVPVGSGDGYYLADLDGDRFIIKPEFDYYCNVTAGKTDAQLLQMKALVEEAKSTGLE